MELKKPFQVVTFAGGLVLAMVFLVFLLWDECSREERGETSDEMSRSVHYDGGEDAVPWDEGSPFGIRDFTNCSCGNVMIGGGQPPRHP